MRIFTDRIGQCSHITHFDRLEVLKRTNDGPQGLYRPKIVTELLSFWNLCSVFCHFVPHFATVVTLLKRKLRSGELQILE